MTVVRGSLVRIVVLTALVSALVATGASAAAAAVQPTGTIGNYNWSPEQEEIEAGESVSFSNPTANPHTVGWGAGAPATPSCTGIPVAGSGNWSGSCTFTQPGDYPFVCSVHPVEMTGTIKVTGVGTPQATTGSGTPTSGTTATLKGTVKPNGVASEYFFNYGTTGAYGLTTAKTPASAGASSVNAEATISSLTPNTTYHFQLVTEYGSGTLATGADKTFTTGGTPVATTDPATSIGSVQATLKGTVNPKGLETKYFFNYGTTATYGEKTTESSLAAGASNVSASKLVSGLSPKTEYHFQIVAKNSAGEIKGADRTFTTVGGPVAITGQAAAVEDGTATLAGVVNPQGQQTSYFFKYGTTAAYGQQTPEKVAGAGTSDVGVSEQLTGLTPGTTYHFQVVAKSPGGTALGEDQAFTTKTTAPPPPPPPIIETGPPPIAPPETTITKKPPAKTQAKSVTIKFSSSVAGASFECKVDGKGFKACRSPFTARGLKPGKHKIQVRALASGVADPSPAVVGFKVVRKRS